MASPGRRLTLVGLAVVLLAGVGSAYVLRDEAPDQNRAGAASGGSLPESSTTNALATTVPFSGWVDPATAGQPWGQTVEGLLTFRGGPTRSWYGEGPVPAQPEVLWEYPRDGLMCGMSTVDNVEREWCGTGWTGQPAVWVKDGQTWVAFGAYDHAVHVVDGDTGDDILPPFPTGDLVKGSITVDPDGYPLLYTGSRDGFFRVLAFDRGRLTELWRLDAESVTPIKWNDDWDGSALVIADHLFEGGENSQFHVVKLNRAYGGDGLVTVAPELVFNTRGWDDELLEAIGDNEVSIENSVAVSGNTVYFSNSGGLVQGWDITGLETGTEPTRVFRFWTGDDTDASVVVDDDGMLYVASEYERETARSQEVGQIMKLDPSRPDDPLVWSVPDHDEVPSGVWATPALYGELVIVATNGGEVMGIDRATGRIRWTLTLPGPTWQSPVVVDDVLIQGDCEGVLHGFDVSDPNRRPIELWRVRLGGCIESTPAMWRGRIYVGTRDGQFFAVGDPLSG